ncbi:MAG TPA: HEAT repeat domain-containing protein, partial [Ktedonobacteraceae bacterium]
TSKIAWDWLYERGEHQSLKEWLAALQHEYSWVRENALKHIEAYDFTLLVEPLLPLLSLHKKDRFSEDIRIECIQALGLLGERVPLQPIQELLSDDDKQVRAQALRVLLQRKILLSPDILLPMLHHSSTSELAAHALALWEAHAPIPALLELVRFPSANAAYGAALSLRLLHEHVSTNAILPLLQNEEVINSYHETYWELVRLLQLQGIEPSLESLVHILRKFPYAESVNPIVTTLCLAGPHAPIELLLRSAYEADEGNSRYPEWTNQLFYVLYEWVTPDNLWHTMNNTQADQLLAVHLLSLVADEESIQLITKVAQDTSEGNTVRSKAMIVLSDLSINLPLEYLLQATRWGIYEGMGYYLEDTVKRLGAQTPIEQLLPLLGEDHNGLQPTVVNSLKNIAQHLSAEIIFPLLEDNDLTIREAAIEIAGTMGARAPLDHFIALLHDKTQNSNIRKTAIRALGEMGTRVPVNILLEMLQDDNKGIRSTVLYHALKERGEPIPLEPLLTLLNDLDGDIIRATLNVLAEQIKIGVTIPIEPIIPLLNHEDKFVVSEAAEVLCQFGANAPIDVLLAHLFDKDTQELNDHLFYELRLLGIHAPLEAMLNALPATIGINSWYISSALEELAEVMPEQILERLHDDPR